MILSIMFVDVNWIKTHADASIRIGYTYKCTVYIQQTGCMLQSLQGRQAEMHAISI